MSKVETEVGERIDFTVAIATFNGAARVPDVLNCLQQQRHLDAIHWEIIVIDNNSTDDTAEVIRQYQPRLPNLRYAFEPIQGAGYARQRAVRLAQSPFVGFLDDDNLPSPQWVYEAYQFLSRNPAVGAVGSRLHGRFECELPHGFERIGAFLALTDRGDTPLPYLSHKKVLPPGAGLAVRREAWLASLPQATKTGLRIRDRDVSEDIETVTRIQRTGWQIWYNPAMHVVHKIPEHRLTQRSLTSLMRGIGLSRHHTRMLNTAIWMRPLVTLAYLVNDTRRVVKHVLTYGRRTWTEPVPASEMALYGYSLVSPLYLGLVNLMQSLSPRLSPPSQTDASAPHLPR